GAKAYPGESSIMRDQVMVDHWCAALNSQKHEKLVRRDDPKNLDAAYHAAIRHEVIDKTVHGHEYQRRGKTVQDRFACAVGVPEEVECAEEDLTSVECSQVVGLQPRRSVIPNPQERYVERTMNAYKKEIEQLKEAQAKELQLLREEFSKLKREPQPAPQPVQPPAPAPVARPYQQPTAMVPKRNWAHAVECEAGEEEL